MERYVLAVSLVLCGCASSPRRAPLWAQDGHTLNTESRCINSAQVLPVAEEQLRLLLEESGLLEDRSRLGEMGVCMIPSPEACCIGASCHGPCSALHCARKAGCATPSSVWVSATWPPQCTASWPDEPNCLPGAPRPARWQETLLHEISHLVRLRLDLPGAGELETSPAEVSALRRWRLAHP